MDTTVETTKTISVRVPDEADAAYVALLEDRRQEAHDGAFAAPERVASVRSKYQQAEHAR